VRWGASRPLGCGIAAVDVVVAEGAAAGPGSGCGVVDGVEAGLVSCGFERDKVSLGVLGVRMGRMGYGNRGCMMVLDMLGLYIHQGSLYH